MLGLPENDDSPNERLTMCIAAASQAIEHYCGRSLRLAERTERYSGTGARTIELRSLPVRRVHAVAVEPDGAAPEFEALDDGTLLHPTGWPEGDRNIVVTYEAGYVLPGETGDGSAPPLPASVELACILYAKMLYCDQAGMMTERLGDYSVTYWKPREPSLLSPAVAALLKPCAGRWL